MKTKLTFCCFLIAIYFLIACEKEKNYPTTIFELTIKDENGIKINNFKGSISADWAVGFGFGSEMKIINGINGDKEIFEVNIKRESFVVVVAYENFNKIGMLKDNILKARFETDTINNYAKLTFERGLFKVGKVNKIELLRDKR
jgi:hypothetical protein